MASPGWRMTACWPTIWRAALSSSAAADSSPGSKMPLGDLLDLPVEVGVMTSRRVRAPRGPQISCRGWPQEAALRMLMNNLDPEVAEKPDELIVYGGTGKAARNWECFDAIVRTLRALENDETLLVQSGKPVGVFRTHPGAPRVLISNAMLVPAWATWEVFRDLERRGLTMFGQMTAGSWIYIGTQGILQGTYETLASVARRRFGGSLAGRWVLTAGLGGMGGAQPLAVTMNGGIAPVVEGDPGPIERRLATGYLERKSRGAQAETPSGPRALDAPGLVRKYFRPFFGGGEGPFRGGAVAGDPADIRRTDDALLEAFPADEALGRWLRLAEEKVKFQG